MLIYLLLKLGVCYPAANLELSIGMFLESVAELIGQLLREAKHCIDVCLALEVAAEASVTVFEGTLYEQGDFVGKVVFLLRFTGC